MIILYALLLLLLWGAQLWLTRRVTSLEKKYNKVAKEADALVKQAGFRDGNSNRAADPYQAARRQYQLAMLADRRDRVEARYAAARQRREKFGKLSGRVRGWNGKLVPYALGVLDVGLALAAAEYLGTAQQLSVHALVQNVTSLFSH